MKDSKTYAKHSISVSTLTLVGLMAAIICILGPLSIPIGPVPISFTNLAIYLAVILLGWKKGTLSYLIYLFIGLVGMPVFSGFSGGAGKLFGPTGGYLIGFIFMAIVSGIFIEKFPDKKYMYIAGMILGTIIDYGFGTAWLAYQAGLTFQEALMGGVIPFLLGDAVKILIALIVGVPIKKQIVKAGLLK